MESDLLIEGMHCGSCVKRVATALAQVPGVEVREVRVGAARFDAAEPAATQAAIDALAKIGFTARAGA